jgi:hypothetical protein
VGGLLQGEPLRHLYAALQHILLGGKVLEPAGLGEAPTRGLKNVLEILYPTTLEAKRSRKESKKARWL